MKVAVDTTTTTTTTATTAATSRQFCDQSAKRNSAKKQHTDAINIEQRFLCIHTCMHTAIAAPAASGFRLASCGILLRLFFLHGAIAFSGHGPDFFCEKRQRCPAPSAAPVGSQARVQVLPRALILVLPFRGVAARCSLRAVMCKVASHILAQQRHEPRTQSSTSGS